MKNHFSLLCSKKSRIITNRPKLLIKLDYLANWYCFLYGSEENSITFRIITFVFIHTNLRSVLLCTSGRPHPTQTPPHTPLFPPHPTWGLPHSIIWLWSGVGCGVGLGFFSKWGGVWCGATPGFLNPTKSYFPFGLKLNFGYLFKFLIVSEPFSD